MEATMGEPLLEHSFSKYLGLPKNTVHRGRAMVAVPPNSETTPLGQPVAIDVISPPF